MLIYASLITIINIVLVYISSRDSDELKKAMEVHLDACRRIRDEIAHMPLASVEMEALAKIEEHIAEVKKTQARLKEIIHDHHIH